ncbi:hypothetical protein RugamoR57_43420 [Duganella caerulea]
MWAVVASACGVAAAVITFGYGFIKDYREGKLGGELELTIDNVPLNRGMPTYVFFPVTDEGARYLIPVGLVLQNRAPVKASDVTLSTRYEKPAERASMADLGGQFSGGRLASDLKSELNGSDKYDYVVHRVNFLSAGESFRLTDGGQSYSIPITLDSYEPLLYGAHQGINVNIAAGSDRDSRHTWDIRYRALAVRNMQQVREVMRTFYAKQVAIDLRATLTTKSYLWRILFGEEVSIVAFAPDFKYVRERKLYVPNDMPKEQLVYRFDPYKWTLLF